MNEAFKIQAFEYLVSKLLDWYQESSSSEKNNDLSILKVLKLTFFTSAVGTSSNTDSSLLDEVFNNYVAMPYGHVESDVYTYIKTGALPNIEINNRQTILNDNYSFDTLDISTKNKIDNSVSLLKSINRDLINLSSFELVDLSHAWYSWQKFYSIAKSKGINSEPIPTDEIKREDKIYQL